MRFYNFLGILFVFLLASVSACEKEQQVFPVYGSEKVYIYTEIIEFGHSFIVLSNDTHYTVYTYGRYGDVDKYIDWGRNTAPTGDGILVRLYHSEAKAYIKAKIEKTQAKAFEIQGVNGALIRSYYDDLFAASSLLPDTGFYKNNDRARVIDQYHILSRNCTTIIHDGLVYANSPYRASVVVSAGGGMPIPAQESPIILPKRLQEDLIHKSNKENSGIIDQSRYVKSLLGIQDTVHIP